MHPHLQLGEALDKRPRRARVIQVDVREEESARLGLERGEERLESALRSGVDERAAQVPAADYALAAALEDVNEPRFGWIHRA